jgi:tRNA(Ile)-lysidine synthase
MKDLIRRVGVALKEACGVGGDRGMLVAVSGGPDSVFLLHVLSVLSKRGERTGALYAANLDHGIRGEESRLDSAFVVKLCGDWDIPLVTESVDTEGGKLPGESLEQAARRIRYDFLESTACMFETDLVATGHTADDQAETLLLRIERGTGVEGARGVMTSRPISPGSKVALVRPILGVQRREIMGYLRTNRILWQTDSTNEDIRYARNRIRLWLSELPDETYARLRGVLCSLAGYASRDWPRLQEAARAALEGAASESEGGLDVSIPDLHIDPEELSPYVVREMIRTAVGDLRRITSTHAEEVGKLVAGPSVGRVELPGGASVVREYDTLKIGRIAEEPAMDVKLDLPVPGEVSLPDGSVVSVRIADGDPEKGMRESGGDPLVEYADAGEVGDSVTVRFREPGDRFRPLGGPGEKCLKAFFIDSKVPRSERDRVPVVVSGDRIVWVAGHRLDERFKLRPESERAVRLEFRRS